MFSTQVPGGHENRDTRRKFRENERNAMAESGHLSGDRTSAAAHLHKPFLGPAPLRKETIVQIDTVIKEESRRVFCSRRRLHGGRFKRLVQPENGLHFECRRCPGSRPFSGGKSIYAHRNCLFFS